MQELREFERLVYKAIHLIEDLLKSEKGKKKEDLINIVCLLGKLLKNVKAIKNDNSKNQKCTQVFQACQS